MRQLVDVDALRRVGDEHRKVAGLELGERPRARTLALVAVDGERADAVVVQLLGELVRAVLRPRENEHLAPIVAADQRRQQRTLAIAIDRMHHLIDDVDRRITRRDVEHQWAVQQRCRQGADLIGERRREQQVLPLLGQQREYALDVVDEAHVEHAVGFVEDENLDAAEIDVALAVMVEQPPGCRDEDVDAAFEQRGLRRHADAADHDRRRQVQMLAVDADRRLDLRGELARGREDQRAQRPPGGPGQRGRACLRLRQLVQHRQHEARRLAGARLCAGEQIAARENGRYCLLLDGGWCPIALFGNGAYERLG